MDRREVVEVLAALASGAHPVTGEVFGEDSPYNHPKVIRALFGCLGLIESRTGRAGRSREEINRERGRPRRANRRWSEEEDRHLVELLQQGTPTGEIARRFERTRGAIHSRLQRQGLLERQEILQLSEEELVQLLQERLSVQAVEVAVESD